MEVFVAHMAGDPNAPFSGELYERLSNQYRWTTADEPTGLHAAIERFQPDIIVAAGWHIKPYRAVMRAWNRRATRIMTMDNCWLGTLKQWLGVATAHYFVQTITDFVWLPGERQAVFAKKMGFETGRVFRGLYTCDHPEFASAYHRRRLSVVGSSRRFLFVGRFIEQKGLSALSEAYKQYRAQVAEPWPLICCGDGPLASMLQGIEGLSVEGFVQPSQLPFRFGEASCLILPSLFEAWGVVVHEAASAGLCILASDRVGAVPHLVQHGYNGFLFDPLNSNNLCSLMVRVSMLNNDALASMSDASYSLSLQFTPARWADTLLSMAV